MWIVRMVNRKKEMEKNVKVNNVTVKIVRIKRVTQEMNVQKM